MANRDIGGIMNTPLNLAVVGHTNTGKTSLLRTLLRDENFGEVADQAGTTRHVESAKLLTGQGETILILYDTPGLEDAMALLDYMDQIIDKNIRLDGPEKIMALLHSPAANDRFEQEARVLQAILKSDAALYVIDARDPVLPKHKDELVLLAACGRPILPVLNFTNASNANISTWRNALARIGLHASLDFDTISPPLDGPDKLLDRLGLLLEQHQKTLDILRADIHQQRQERLQDATLLIAELLIDVASFRLSSPDDSEQIKVITDELRNKSNQREQQCVDALLKTYQFSSNIYQKHTLPLTGERWDMDLFNPDALRDFGIELGKGAATGAMAGLTVDVLLGGLSLGSAALIGAIAGGSWQGLNKWGKRIFNRITGSVEITVDDAVLTLLTLRQLSLVHALEQRGHAAIDPIKELNNTQATQQPVDEKQQAINTLPNEIKKAIQLARTNPDWSAMATSFEPDSRKQELVQTIAKDLYQLL